MGLLRWVEIACALLFMWHLYGCGYFGIAHLTTGFATEAEELDGAWTPPEWVRDRYTRSEQYMWMIYWAVLVLSGINTVGYPQTPLQAFFMVLTMSGVIMYSILIGAASSLLLNLDSESARHRMKMRNIDEYLRRRFVEKSLSTEIKQFYNYSHQFGIDETRKDMIDELRRVSGASSRSRSTCKLLESVPIFEKCEIACIVELIQRFKQFVCAANEFIIRQVRA